MSLADSKHLVWYSYYESWLLAFILKIILFSLFLTICRSSNFFDYTLLDIQISRLLNLILLAALQSEISISEEHTSLLINIDQSNEHVDLCNTTYESTTIEKSSSDDVDLKFEVENRKKKKKRLKDIKKRLKTNENWFIYAREFFIFLSYVWSSNSNWRLQINVLDVMICLICIRALNILISYQLEIVINALRISQDRISLMMIELYIALLTTSSNVDISLIKSWLWLFIEQYAYKFIKTTSFNHIMNMSCDFHDNKQSEELYKSIEQSSSVNDLLETILFETFSTLVDLIVTYVYIYYLFDSYMLLTVAVMTIVFLWTVTCYSVEQSEYRRRNTEIVKKEAQIMYDSVDSWTTVTYFNRSIYELKRYTTVIEQYMQSQRKMYVVYYLVWTVQSVIMKIDLFDACLIATYQVRDDEKSIENFAILIIYWVQFTDKSFTWAFSAWLFNDIAIWDTDLWKSDLLIAWTLRSLTIFLARLLLIIALLSFLMN